MRRRGKVQPDKLWVSQEAHNKAGAKGKNVKRCSESWSEAKILTQHMLYVFLHLQWLENWKRLKQIHFKNDTAYVAVRLSLQLPTPYR